jgi:hypothetical protein
VKIAFPNSSKRFRPGNHSESRIFKKIKSVKTGRIHKWSNFGSNIRKNWKSSSILSFFPLEDKKLNEREADQMEIIEAVVSLKRFNVKPDAILASDSIEALPLLEGVSAIESRPDLLKDKEPLDTVEPPQSISSGAGENPSLKDSVN